MKVWIVVSFVSQEHIQNQANRIALLVHQEHILLQNLQSVHHVQLEHIHHKKVWVHVIIAQEEHIQNQAVLNVWNAPQVIFLGGV